MEAADRTVAEGGLKKISPRKAQSIRTEFLHSAKARKEKRAELKQEFPVSLSARAEEKLIQVPASVKEINIEISGGKIEISLKF